MNRSLAWDISGALGAGLLIIGCLFWFGTRPDLLYGPVSPTIGNQLAALDESSDGLAEAMKSRRIKEIHRGGGEQGDWRHVTMLFYEGTDDWDTAEPDFAGSFSISSDPASGKLIVRTNLDKTKYSPGELATWIVSSSWSAIRERDAQRAHDNLWQADAASP